MSGRPALASLIVAGEPADEPPHRLAGDDELQGLVLNLIDPAGRIAG
jgi:hypothetical protein